MLDQSDRLPGSPRPNVTVNARPAGDGLHLVLSGELDLLSLDHARERLLMLLHEGSGEVVLDLGGMRFVSVAGARLLAEVAGSCRDAGRVVRMRHASRQLLRVLVLCDLHVESG